MPETLHTLWLENVRHAPHAPAAIDAASGKVWSRIDLDQASDAWLARLPAGACLAGQRVAFAEPNGVSWLAVFIGLLKVGAIAIPLDPADPDEARRSASAAARARWLWTTGSWHALASRRPARRLDGCLIKLTSGSTGTPRPLLFSHRQMIVDCRQICASMEIRPDDLNLGIIPFGHSYGLGNLVGPLLVQGTTLLVAASPLPNALAADCARWKPTVFPAVPALLHALASSEIEPLAISSLRTVVSAGAPLRAEVASAFARRFGIRLHSFYGSSETGGITYDRTGEATLLGRSVGTALDGVSLAFRRGQRFDVVSDAVMSPGRHSPPDKACLNEFGELVLLGRTGRIAKIAGRRVDLGEIENSLRAVPGVDDAVAAPHPSRTEALAAVVAGKIDAKSLRLALRTRMALWKIPERIVVVPALPLTSRGKTDRKEIRRLLAS